jgi:MFS family permease
MRVDRVGYLGWLRTPARARSGRAPFWILVAVTATGTLAMHILVPALPLVAADFGVSRGTIQLAITLYLFGISGGQLLYGRSPTSSGGGRPCLSPLVFMSWQARSPAGRQVSEPC